MRHVIGRGIVGVALAAATLLAASACSKLPQGADGNLTNQWTGLPEPTSWEPVAESCHKDFQETSYRNAYVPLECDEAHFYETVTVGTFTGSATEGSAPPVAGSVELRAAYADCDKKTTSFLGKEWRTGMVWIGVSVPSRAGWGGGARWYRCEVAALDDRYGDPVSRRTSLADEFTKASDLLLGCYSYKDSLVSIACGSAHNAEFAGIYQTGDTAFAQLSKLDDKMASECRKIIAGYVKVPNDANMKYRTGVVWNWPSQADWDAGDHGVRCHLWFSKKTVAKSLKGAGNAGMPIQYK